jgi:hypothetical protein
MKTSTMNIHQIVSGWLIRVIVLFTLTASMLSGCSRRVNDEGEIEAGLSKEAVIQILGDPDQVNEFILPDGPFFGPQEGLTGLVPPGQLVEEWVYHTNGEVRYVWFWGDSGQEREAWRVVLTSVYPKDVVY